MSVHTAPLSDATEAEALAERLVEWLEDGVRRDDLFAPNTFADLSLPHWRVQSSGADGVYHLREDNHPQSGSVRVERLEPTASGFVIQFEERWHHGGQDWYCREMIRAVVAGGLVQELAVYCTGDWDEQTQQRHAAEVLLARP